MELSIIIPTYNERENIENLVDKIFSIYKSDKIDGEIIIVDDNSSDGTGVIAEELKKKHKKIKVIHRSGKLGLSSAVLEGFKVSDGEVFGVMDADLSHPPEKISEMFGKIKSGEADFVIGSRYIPGGKIIGWNLKRKLMSKFATYLARPFTKVRDPMTGFFMIKKECIIERDFDAQGFKILLELLMKAKYNSVIEVPIVFINRTKGQSKAGMNEIFFYIKNLIGYLKYIDNPLNKVTSKKGFSIYPTPAKFDTIKGIGCKNTLMEFIRFAIVGGIGTVINLFILYTFTEFFNVYYLISAIFAFVTAVSCNFILNKIWTFKESLNEKTFIKYGKFFIISLIGLAVNLIFLYVFTEYFGIYYLISQLLAIGIALIVNFFGNKKWTFRR